MYNNANLEGDPRLELEENGRDFLEPVRDAHGTYLPTVNESCEPARIVVTRALAGVTPSFEEYLSAAERQRAYEEARHKGEVSSTTDTASADGSSHNE